MQDIVETENRRQVAAPSKKGLSQGVESAVEMRNEESSFVLIEGKKERFKIRLGFHFL